MHTGTTLLHTPHYTTQHVNNAHHNTPHIDSGVLKSSSLPRHGTGNYRRAKKDVIRHARWDTRVYTTLCNRVRNSIFSDYHNQRRKSETYNRAVTGRGCRPELGPVHGPGASLRNRLEHSGKILRAHARAACRPPFGRGGGGPPGSGGGGGGRG